MSTPRASPPALLAALAILSALPGCGRGAQEPFTMVSPDEVERLIREGGVLVVDANSRDTYDRSHLPGAVHYRAAPLAELLPADRERAVVFYCASPS